jgi:hypothetical protein
MHKILFHIWMRNKQQMPWVISRVSVKHLNRDSSYNTVYCPIHKIPKYTRISLKSDIMHGLNFECIKYTLKLSH